MTVIRKCWVDGCSDKAHSWGMCVGHRVLWENLVRTPRTHLKNKSDEERFEHYVTREPSEEVQKIFGVKPDCWVWSGGLDPSGYGVFNSAWSKLDCGSVRAHLFSLVNVGNQERMLGFEADHTCRIRPCVNHAHVEQVTQKENSLRGIGFAARNARKRYCSKGHEFTPENTFINEDGWRSCRKCNREYNREYTSRPEVKDAIREKREPKSGVRGRGQYQAQKDTCNDGHKLEGDNLIIETKVAKGRKYEVRRCRTCRNVRAKDNHAKRVSTEIFPGVRREDCLTSPEVAILLGIERTYFPTFRKRQASFPKPVRVGRPSLFLKEDVVSWHNRHKQQES